MPAFVGRSEELRALVEVGAQAHDGLSAVMIVGDPGSGKTRLLAEASGHLGDLTQLRVLRHMVDAVKTGGLVLDLLVIRPNPLRRGRRAIHLRA